MASGTKRKSNYKTDDFVASDNSEDRPAKRGKSTNKASTTTKSSFLVSKDPQTDDNGDTYWDISKMRRITISEFKGMSMVNIREYYEQNGKSLPGKKVSLCAMFEAGHCRYRQYIWLTESSVRDRASAFLSSSSQLWSSSCQQSRRYSERKASPCLALTSMAPTPQLTLETTTRMTRMLRERPISMPRAMRTKTKRPSAGICPSSYHDF
jgi:hypothetical protein